MQSLVGQLLVATPVLRDPNFERTVVLLVAHENGGAIGVVLNRATEVPVREVLGSWGGVATEPSVVFEGGPVQPEAAICLARVRTGTTELRGFSRVQGTLGTVDGSVIENMFASDVAFLQDFYRRINAEGHTRIAVTCPECSHRFTADLAGGRLGES